MSRKNVGIEEARKGLGDLVTAVQQGADVVLTRNGKPAARIIRYTEEPTMATITFATAEQAAFIAEMPELAGNGHPVVVMGVTAALDAEALAVLAELPDDNDGHYDGTHVWVGGSEYAVNRPA